MADDESDNAKVLSRMFAGWAAEPNRNDMVVRNEHFQFFPRAENNNEISLGINMRHSLLRFKDERHPLFSTPLFAYRSKTGGLYLSLYLFQLSLIKFGIYPSSLSSFF
jgi:hypothetical protein